MLLSDEAVFLLPLRRLRRRAGDDAREPAECASSSSAGAIWLVDRLPRPHSATPNFRPGACALPTLLSSGQGGQGGGLRKKSTAIVYGHDGSSRLRVFRAAEV